MASGLCRAFDCPLSAADLRDDLRPRRSSFHRQREADYPEISAARGPRAPSDHSHQSAEDHSSGFHQRAQARVFRSTLSNFSILIRVLAGVLFLLVKVF